MTIQKHYAYFSAAIRDGAKLRPQAFGVYFWLGGSCAIGAAAEAMGMRDDVSSVECAHPYMFGTAVICPANCAELSGSVGSLVYMTQHLNDIHRWSREAIADWLYAEEEKLGFETLIETEASPAMSPEITTVEKLSQASQPEKSLV